jgi:fused signal recognition particle receptor
MGFLDRLREGLTRTKQQIVDRFEDLVQKADAPEQRTRQIDVETIESLEEILIGADIGVPATERIVTAVRGRARQGESLRDLVKTEIRQIFDNVRPPAAANGHTPHVTLIVGVNGTGKTTTIGKLANLMKKSGRQPLVCAATRFAPPRWSSWRSGPRAPASISCVRRKARIRRPWCSMRFSPAGRGAATRSWSTPRAGCTRAST